VRDTQWRVATRNALDKVKSMEDLFDATDEIGSQSDKVMQSFHASVQEILYSQGWSTEDVNLYLGSGLLPRIVQRFLQYYYKMFLHFQKLAAKDPDPDHFREYTMLHIKHHARQLRQIRLYAPRRSLMILRSYTYLRDAKEKGFTDIKLMGALAQKLQEMTSTLTDLAGSASLRQKPPKEWACSHCHSEIHQGGPNECPLKDLKTKVSRRLANEAEKKIKEDPDVLARLIAEEKAKPKP
jgi:hypothetical protein